VPGAHPRSTHKAAARALPAFLERVLASELDPALLLSLAMAEIDRRLRAQVQAILAHPDFRRLEAAWSSLEYLVDRAPENAPVHVRVLNLSRAELGRDFEDAIEFDRSALFQLVYEREFGTFGGEPFGLLVADFEFGPSPDDVALLEGLSQVASAAHAVALAGASPDLVGLASWRGLARAPVPRVALPNWERLRRREDSRYLALVLPRVLLRLPHRPGDPGRWLGLREDSFATDGSGYLWGNAAFALAERAMTAFAETGWCTAIRGLEDDWGVVRGLPEESFSTDTPGVVVRPPAEVALSESQEKDLVEQGLVPLCRVPLSPRLAFFTLPSLHAPPAVTDAELGTNLRLAAQLPYLLAASRFAHYLKCLLRDRVGGFADRVAIQRELSTWLARYALDDVNAPPERQARWPLRSFAVTVRDKPGRPAHMEAIVHLQPHFQLEDPNVTVKLTLRMEDSS
jgi:type VI secretion system protein ImpC